MNKSDILQAAGTCRGRGGEKGRGRPVEILHEDDVLSLVSACSPRAPTGVRNRALLVVLWRAGLRISEALALRPRDLNSGVGSLQVLHGKGGKARTVGLDPMAFSVLDRWIEKRAERSIPRGAWLFCTLQGAQLKPSYVRALFPRLAQRAGLDRRVHAHALRHTFAAELAREGVPMNQIQKQLGHSSLAVTSRYLDHISPTELLDTIASRPVPKGAARLMQP